jgi:hypothetical protein
MTKTKRPKVSVDSLKPYLDRAIHDPHFRDDLKDALEAARELYAPLTKGNGGVAQSARHLATDKKAHENLSRLLDDLGSAADALQGKKRKSSKGRNTMLLAGLIAGALYNPWTGAHTRDWLLGKIAGDEDLQPLEDLVPSMPESAAAAAADDAEE